MWYPIPQYCVATKNGKYRNTALKIDEIRIPHLDPLIIGHANLSCFHQGCLFQNLKYVCIISKTYRPRETFFQKLIYRSL